MNRGLTWLLVAGALGCAHPGLDLRPESAAQPAPATPVALPEPTDAVVLHRTACSGHCPVYTLTVLRTGQARFVGEQDVGRVGEEAWRLERLYADHLFGELERSGFLALAPRYPTEVEEFPGLVLTWRRAGVEHRVQLGGPGTEDLPRDAAAERLLGKLATLVDKLTGSKRFVDTGPRPAGAGCVD